MKLTLKAKINRQAVGDIDEDLEQILSSAYWSYQYARDQVRGPWPQGEMVIAKDPIFSTLYALECLGLSQEEAEQWGKNYLLLKSHDQVEAEAVYDMRYDRFIRDLTLLRNVYDRTFDQNKYKRWR